MLEHFKIAPDQFTQSRQTSCRGLIRAALIVWCVVRSVEQAPIIITNVCGEK